MNVLPEVRVDRFLRRKRKPDRIGDRLRDLADRRRRRLRPPLKQLLDQYLPDHDYLITGPSVWKRLGLGCHTAESIPLVYHKHRTGFQQMDGELIEFRARRFPEHPSREFFVVDLLNNAVRAGLQQMIAERALRRALLKKRLDRARLASEADEFGTPATRKLIEKATPDTPATASGASTSRRPSRAG